MTSWLKNRSGSMHNARMVWTLLASSTACWLSDLLTAVRQATDYLELGGSGLIDSLGLHVASSQRVWFREH
jgi:hypothetical protein